MRSRCFLNKALVIICTIIISSFDLFPLEKISPSRISDITVSKAIYRIDKDVDLQGGTLTMPVDCTLMFEGGSIYNGKIVFNNTTIIAPDYPIFTQNTSYSGTVTNHEINADWFDAISDCSSAISGIIALGENRKIILPRQQYYIDKTIVIDKKNISIESAGKLLVSPSKSKNMSSVFDLRTSFTSLNLGTVQYDSASSSDKISAIKLTGNVYHADISVKTITNFNIGIDLCPIISDRKAEPNGVGIQYCRFSWQQIRCNTGINFDLWRNSISSSYENDNSSTVWINENQFFGGRIIGKNGIIVNRSNPLKNKRADLINGNVFSNIGFEGITVKPISLYGMTFCQFNAIRMCESLPDMEWKSGTTWIDIDNCTFLKFDIKSAMFHKRVKATNSSQISLYGSFTDAGINTETGNTVLFIDKITSPGGTVSDVAVSTSHIVPKNTLKKLYYDYRNVANSGNATNPVRVKTISVNELYATYYDGQTVLSDICSISLYDQVQLVVNLDNAKYTIPFEMTIVADLHDKTKIIFKRGTQTLQSVETSGTYRLSSDLSTPTIIKIGNVN